MKKIFLPLLMALIIAFPNTAVLAIDLGSGITGRAAEEAGFDKNTTETTFAETIGVVIRAALSFVGVIFLALMVYAGINWMIARGDETKIEKAQDIIRAAIIGLIITVGAYSITAWVVPKILERTVAGG